MKRRRSPFLSLFALAPLVLAGCGTDEEPNPVPPAPSPVASVALTGTHSAPLSAPVDMVRDEWGIPHIYGVTIPDVAYVQGYVMAQDRFPLMDLGRRQASGTLAELFGGLSPATIDSDIQMRVHHLRKTAEDGLAALQASTDPQDQTLVAVLNQFAAGVNAYLHDLKTHQYKPLAALGFLYDPTVATPWTPVDSIVLGQLQAFSLAFDADSEIQRTEVDAKAKSVFDGASDPDLLARKGVAEDFLILAPLDPTHTIGGWTGMSGDTSTARLDSPIDPGILGMLAAADRKTVQGIGLDHAMHPTRGSNNWIVGPSLSTSGHVLVANDTHLSLSNPPIFYLNHVVASGGTAPTNVMGVQFAGIPGVILGMNKHVAWGATVNNIDVTDVYAETVVPCDGSTNPCVTFKGAKVPLVPRVEKIGVGYKGEISSTKSITLYDDPNHGPIVPRITPDHAVEAIASNELSIVYTGYQPAQLVRAVFGIDRAATMKEAVAALDKDFKYGGQNWVIGDDQGHFGWTQTIRVPRRAKTSAPWKVMPGDGTAEWGADMDPRYIPHAYDPAKGFLATANNDPIGVTDDGDPFFDEPVVDGAPLYLGADYDPGTRVGRITKRIEAATANGKKLALADMGDIQSDAITEWGQAIAPTFVDAAKALAAEIAQPGTNADLTAIATSASPFAKGAIGTALTLVTNWSFDTPSGVAEDMPSATQIADSQATLIMAMWRSQFAAAALGDEQKALGAGVQDGYIGKLIVRMCTHPELLKSGISPMTNDSILFDDLATKGVIESKRQIAAQALLLTLDALSKLVGSDVSAWRWGQVHTLTLDFPAGLSALNLPAGGDKTYPQGYPRHGDDGTVDVGGHGLSTTDFTYDEGPAIRFSCELDPDKGPQAKNALPGGEVFDPASPHYSDQLELWRKNKTFDLAYADADVVASALKELAAHGTGRVRFAP